VSVQVYRNPKRFVQDWQRYALDQALTRYGQPTRATFATEPGPHYALVIIYDQLGFFIIYVGPATQTSSGLQACPVFNQMTEIILELHSPEAGPIVGEIEPSSSLEGATGMNLETFYETFKNPDSQVCLEKPFPSDK